MKRKNTMGWLALAGLIAAMTGGVRAEDATDRSGDALENRPASKATPGPQTGDDGFQLPAGQERPGGSEQNQRVQEQSGQGTRQEERIERRTKTTERKHGAKRKHKTVKSETKTETETSPSNGQDWNGYEPENR